MPHTFNDRATFVRAGHAGIARPDYRAEREYDYRAVQAAALGARRRRRARAAFQLLSALLLVGVTVVGLMACWVVSQ